MNLAILPGNSQVVTMPSPQIAELTPKSLLLLAASHESRIEHMGFCMAAAHERYVATGCFDARGEADGHRMAMERAIAARSPAVVAFMEAERGLS